MKKWGIAVVFCSFFGGCTSGEIIYLTNRANQQVQCGPYQADSPVGQFFEDRYGGPEANAASKRAAARLGDAAETKLRACVEDYQQQGYERARFANYPAIATQPVKPFDDTAAATTRSDYATEFRDTRPLAEQGVASAVQPARPFNDAAAAAERGDYATVFRHMRPLAEQGDAAAQTVLGKAYEDGLGVPQDYIQAHKWYNLAAANSTKSEKRLRRIAFEERAAVAGLMSREQIAEAQKLAREWERTPAE